MKRLKKTVLAVMLLMGMSVSLSADEIVGTWVYDKKASLVNAKSEDEKCFLKDAKAEDLIFDSKGHFGHEKMHKGKWKKTIPLSYELTAPNKPAVKVKIEKKSLLFIMDLGDFGIITAYYKKK